MRIAIAASEAAPFVKTGGLGDVMQALPLELSRIAHNEISVFLPYYGMIKYGGGWDMEFLGSFEVQMAWRREYVGVLRIPKLGLELPVMSSWSYPKLKKAPCRYAGTAYLHNMVIAAHNYPQFFRNIDQLEPGDSVTFTDMDGNVFTYEVTGHEIIQPTEIDRMVNGDWDLTFFRCTYAARARYAVRCKLVS